MAFPAIFLACIWKKKKDKNKTSPPHSELPSTTVDFSWSFHPRVHISMGEIAKATDNFSSDLIISKGSLGLVYKARLSSGFFVAIKKLSPDAFRHGYRRLQAEVETLAKLRHRNIIKILGSLASGPHGFLVYEFMERQSLDLWLHDYPAGNNHVAVESLPWDTRAKIIRGVANGLRYLHELEKPIIHRDIRATSVFLDSEFEPHIADFGLASIIGPRYSQVSSQVVGSFGYMAPECKAGVTVANVKMDVFSFGVLMLEIITGHQPNFPVKLGCKELELVEWARKMLAQNGQIVDPKIRRDVGISETSVKECIGIAFMCCNELHKDRPTMTQVVDLLDKMPM